MKPITAYRCDHCKRVTVTQRAMKAHEQQCIHNPDERACPTCVHDFKHEGCDAGARLDAEKLVRHCPAWAPSEEHTA